MGEKMKKAGKVMGIIIMSLLPGIIAFYFLLSFIIAPAVNDHIAKKLYKEMVQVPLPEGAVVCDSRFLAGNLVGNGNKMQYFVALLLRSEWTMEELEDYYLPYREDKWHFIVERQEGTGIGPLEGREEFSIPGEKKKDENTILCIPGAAAVSLFRIGICGLIRTDIGGKNE